MTLSVRHQRDQPPRKGKIQGVFVLAKGETAQVYYDANGKVTAISINYVGKGVTAPLPTEIIGESLQPKPDGSMYALKRYPEAGYWVSYNRTAGDDPIVSIAMQKLP